MNVSRSFFTVPLYPPALTAAFVLGSWLQSSLDVIPLLRPLAIAIGAAAAITAVPVLLMRDRNRGGHWQESRSSESSAATTRAFSCWRLLLWPASCSSWPASGTSIASFHGSA